ncbi:four helix bundle protein [Mariniflexile soesokkakense]|uniref:Four helix bundle protein n=1 Tax=Mariniflexile soesokkakense TaxID=1343160 RepID=A0ABV0A8I9_9FLAO
MSEIKTYKDLLIWQKGIEIVKETYLLCKEIPNDELFGLQSQIKRSSISIPSNIAEGWGRNYTKNYLQFLKYSRGSLLELETQIIIAKELNFISTESFNKIQDLISEESKMLNAFIKSIDK